jgi:hypothetical protein
MDVSSPVRAVMSALLALGIAAGCGTLRENPFPLKDGSPSDVPQDLPDAPLDRQTTPVDGAAEGGPACSGTQTLCSGTCFDLQNDPGHCGTCVKACPGPVTGTGTITCTAGMCGVSCTAGPSACKDSASGATSCVDLQNDGNNCGTCAHVCATGQVCKQGLCATSCDTNLTPCDSSCVDLTTDVDHCGSCTGSCPRPTSGGGATCANSTCAIQCTGSLTNCGTDCLDTKTNLANCGACGRTCAAGQTCVQGLCCAPGQANCGGGVCIDLGTNPFNCGICGNACAVGAGGVCCNGGCAALATSAGNCGACGHSCQGSTCAGSRCQPRLYTKSPSRFMTSTTSTVFQSAYSFAKGATIVNSFPRAGGGANTAFISASPDTAWSINNAGGFFYWDFNHTMLMRTPFIDGDPPMQSVGTTAIYTTPAAVGMDYRAPPFYPADIQLAGNRVCVATAAIDGSNAGLICMNSADGGAPATILATGLAGPFATDSTNVYFANTAPSIDQSATTGGAVTRLTNIFGAPYTLAADGAYVWYVTGAQIVRLQAGLVLQSGTPIFNIPAADTVPSIFGDGTYVYWLENVGSGPPPLNFPNACTSVVLYRKARTDGTTTAAPEVMGTYSDATNGSCATSATWNPTGVIFSAGDRGAGDVVFMAK